MPRGGVWVCDLREARSGEELTAIVLRTLGIIGDAHEPDAQVERALATRGETLIVLDNMDRLMAEGPLLVRSWVRAARSVRFIITSRRALGLSSPGPDMEDVLELGALKLPEPGTATGEAVDLFVERVRTVHRSYAPREGELSSIAELVRRLLGVPLAIELAAARIGSTDPGELLSQVPTAPATPRAVDRAWTLLSTRERELLSQCSVFRGGFTLEMASRVVQQPGAHGDSGTVTDALIMLARKSLLQVERTAPLRLSMCESIREHAAEVLATSEDAMGTQFRHAQSYYDLAGSIAGLGGQPTMPIEEASLERDNLQSAMAFGATAERPTVVLRTAIALDAISMGSGLSRMQLALLDEALRAGATRDVSLLGRALGVRAAALRALGRLGEATSDANMALTLAQETKDLRQIGAMHRAVGSSSFQQGELTAALEHYERALAIERERGDHSAVSAVLEQLGAVQQTLGNTARARSYYRAALALAVEIADPAAEARASIGLGSYYLELGDLVSARECYERGLATAARLRMTRTQRIVGGYLGVLCFDSGELADAERHLAKAATSSREAGDLRVEGIFEGIRGAVLACQRRLAEARESFDLAERLLRPSPFFAGVIAIHRGHLDLAEAREAFAASEDLDGEACIAAAKRRIVDACLPSPVPRADAPRPLVHRSDDARIAVRILDRAIAAMICARDVTY